MPVPKPIKNNGHYLNDGTVNKEEGYRYCLGECDDVTEHVEEGDPDDLRVTCMECGKVSNPII